MNVYVLTLDYAGPSETRAGIQHSKHQPPAKDGEDLEWISSSSFFKTIKRTAFMQTYFITLILHLFKMNFY